MPTITAESHESFSAQIFKIPTHCLSTTLTLRNPGQRRLEIKIPFANQSIFSCYRVQNLLSEIMWYEVNRCQRFAGWRSGGLLAQKFNRRTTLEPTTKLSYEALNPPLRQTAVSRSPFILSTNLVLLL